MRMNAKEWLQKQQEREYKMNAEIFKNQPSQLESIEGHIDTVFRYFLLRAVNDSATLSEDQQVVVEKQISNMILTDEPIVTVEDIQHILNLATYINSCQE